MYLPESYSSIEASAVNCNQKSRTMKFNGVSFINRSPSFRLLHERTHYKVHKEFALLCTATRMSSGLKNCEWHIVEKGAQCRRCANLISFTGENFRENVLENFCRLKWTIFRIEYNNRNSQSTKLLLETFS